MNKDYFSNHYWIVILSLIYVLTTTPSFAFTTASTTTPVLIIDDIICQGNDNTECDFITKKYYQHIGDVLNADEIADARLRLGTLIQFKYINIHLEKSAQRNHVVVVFDVHEASNIQYELRARYSHSTSEYSKQYCSYNLANNPNYHSGLCDSKHTGNFGGFTSKVTDFNFWGTGKELSLFLSGNINDRETNQTLTSPSDLALSYTSKHTSQVYDLGLSYYDPYLFGSAHYYLNSSLAISYNNSGTNSATLTADSAGDLIRYGTDQSDELSIRPLHVSLGRRFARHSYVALNVQADIDNGEEYYSLSYGWNSTDDQLFPTRGSVFTSSINLDKKHHNLSMFYNKHFSLANNKVLSLGGYALFSGYESSLNASNGGISASYTSINVIDKLNGSYSGWHVGVGIGGGQLKYNDQKSFNANINAGYTHQTESMIYRLSLSLSLEESK